MFVETIVQIESKSNKYHRLVKIMIIGMNGRSIHYIKKTPIVEALVDGGKIRLISICMIFPKNLFGVQYTDHH